MQTLRRTRFQPAIQHTIEPHRRSVPGILRPPLPVPRTRLSVSETRIYQILRVLFVLIPLLAGVDKFFSNITEWDGYVPIALTSAGIPAHPVMLAAGLLEIAIACLVAVNPKRGSLAMIALLFGIVVDLFVLRGELPLALLDCCLIVNAFCLFLLATKQNMRTID